MESRINPKLDPTQLRKRVLLFYFAAGVNLLMALWVGSAGGGSEAGAGTLTLVTLVFIGFGGLNYYMARKLQKYLKRLNAERSAPAGVTTSDEVTK